jgi:hypothetical protein
VPATIAVTPAAPTAITDACAVVVAGLTLNDTTSYTTTVYPTSPEVRYYLTFELDGAIVGKSHVFAPTNAGGYDGYFNYIFPEAGSWTVRVSNAATDGSVATQAVTVS